MPVRFQDSVVRALAEELAGHPRELAALIHASRVIGSDPGLVLHGGGNTSAKASRTDIFGKTESVLYVKGSGIDMASIGPGGFSVLRLDPLRRLKSLSDPSEDVLESHLYSHRLAPGGPNPSVEVLLHAFLPHRFIFHCHADAVLILTHQQNPKTLIRSAMGEKVAVLPYARPGFPLAKAGAQAFEKAPDIDAIVVLNHGLFTFGNKAKQACDRMLAYVRKAERFLRKHTKKSVRAAPARRKVSGPRVFREAARVSQAIRGLCAFKNGNGQTARCFVVSRLAPEWIRASLTPEASFLCRSGVLTPDHAVRTLNRMVHVESVPEADDVLKAVLKKSVAAFRKHYARHLWAKSEAAEAAFLPEQTRPVLFFVAGLGIFAVGETLKAACIAADIGERTVSAKLKALSLGTYRPIPAAHVREMELWPPQRRKAKTASRFPLTGQVGLVTGGGGAIGYGTARRLLASGAAVALADIDAARLERSARQLSGEFGSENLFPVVFDVTDLSAVKRGFEAVSNRFGGVDLVVANAGIAHVAKIEDLEPKNLDRVFAVNLKGTFTTLKAAIPVFRRQGTGGNVVLISSKNVFDPGAAFSAYSASKAAAHQMAKIAALELAELGVRVNMINPDAVFGDEKIDSGLWELVGPDRMRSRGLSPEGLQDYYRQRSLLKVKVLAEHVGNAVVFFASDQTPTTGASLPVDGGNPAAFPR